MALTTPEIESGETVTVSINIYKFGESFGEYEVSLRIDTKPAETKVVALEAGGMRQIRVSSILDEPGKHVIEIGYMLGSVIMESEVAPPEQIQLPAE